MKVKQLQEIILATKDWHQEIIRALKQIMETENIVIEGNNEEKIRVPKEHLLGFHLGVQVAINLIEDFPIKIEEK